MVYVIGSLLYIPIVIYIPALAFNQVSGINIHTITPIICGICIFYTTIGGLKAVVWADTLQFIITLASRFTIFVIGTVSAGGFGNIWEISKQGERIEFFKCDLFYDQFFLINHHFLQYGSRSNYTHNIFGDYYWNDCQLDHSSRYKSFFSSEIYGRSIS
ncbi:SSF domain containing protein [Asbolus verrucosus]|uniref:SSF domain containing protein n=1 Tax=Asbolus verrucosus TaxID=1661398 RepID=A0A482W7Y9_ASBVE|nr:SSF domain containing protein [Asbolus verrucosus]